jgi:1-acyl-sn-glycerol-3-phosphate acyltransferase
LVCGMVFISLLEAVLTLWAYSAILVVCSICFIIQVIIFPFLYYVDPSRYYVGRLFRLSSVIACKLNPLWNFEIYGSLPPRIPKRTVCISNHLSLADSALISNLPWEMKWMAKSSLFWIPFIGWMMYLSGDIRLRRGVPESGKEAIEQCKIWLSRGANVMIFPEGTRSTSGELMKFKDGAFNLAISTHSDILPIAVVGTGKCIPVHSWKMGFSKGLVCVGRPISTRGMTDIESLKNQARNQIQEMISRMKTHLAE